MSMRLRSLAVVCALLAGGTSFADSPTRTPQAFELRAAILHLGHVRTLGQRLSRQNLLAQTRLVADQRPAMVQTASEMDALLRMLTEGDTLLSVPAPATPKLREAMDAVETAWSPLRTLALSSPADYLRRSGLQGRIPPGDPLLVRYVDDLAQALGERVGATIALYQGLCEQQDLAGCSLDTSTQAPAILERLAKHAAFVVSSQGGAPDRVALDGARAEFTAALKTSVESPRAHGAMAPEHGTAGLLVRGIGSRIGTSWEQLRGEVDRVLEGASHAPGLERLLRAQSELLYSFQRFSIALLAVDTPLAAGGSPDAELFRYEYAAAQRWLGRLRALTQRLNKDNLLYRLRIEEEFKLDSLSISTANQIDEALGALRRGDPRVAVPRPPTPEIEEALTSLEQKWVPIRRMAQANPFDYLRGNRLFVNRPEAQPDPLLLRYFDRAIGELVAAVEDTSRRYTAACARDGYRFCERSAEAGLAEMRSEQLIREAVLHFAGIDSEGNLPESRASFDRLLLEPSGRFDLGAVGTADAPEARHALASLDETRNVWSALRRELEFVADGTADAPNLRRAIELQRRIAVELDRLEVAVGRLVLFDASGEVPRDVAAPPPDDRG